MKMLTAIALLIGSVMVAGCHTSGISISENKMIDNNCSGNGFMNKDWCDNELHPSMGPRAGM